MQSPGPPGTPPSAGARACRSGHPKGTGPQPLPGRPTAHTNAHTLTPPRAPPHPPPPPPPAPSPEATPAAVAGTCHCPAVRGEGDGPEALPVGRQDVLHRPRVYVPEPDGAVRTCAGD